MINDAGLLNKHGMKITFRTFLSGTIIVVVSSISGKNSFDGIYVPLVV